MILQKAISLHIDIDLEFKSVKILHVKKNGRTGGRQLACELPKIALEKVQKWALDTKATHFSLFTERVHFWTTKATKSATSKSKLAAASIDVTPVVAESAPVGAAVLEPKDTSSTEEPAVTPITISTTTALAFSPKSPADIGALAKRPTAP